MFKRLKLPPGIDRESTEYSAEGAWFDSNNIRFRGLYPECIGGWEQDSTYTLEGIGRDITAWSSYSGYEYICVATNWKFYVIYGGVAYDITPVRETQVLGSNPFAATSGSSTIVVTDTSHGATNNDFVTFSGATSLGTDSTQTCTTTTGETNLVVASSTGLVGYGVSGVGIAVGTTVTAIVDGTNVTLSIAATADGTVTLTFTNSGISAAVLNQEYQVFDVTTNTYKIIAKDVNGDPVSSISTVTAGGTPTAKYQLNVGFITPQSGSGWGVGVWGESRAWGDPSDLSVVLSSGIRLNYVDNYGEDLLIANKDGEIYYWDLSASSVTTTGVPDGDRALPLDDSGFTGNSGTPVAIGSFLVSDRDGHCISLGSNDLGGTAKNDLLVRWSDQNNPFDWTPSSTNTSGGQVLRVGTKILGGIAAREEILVWTDAALYSMRYIGPPSTFSFNLVSGNVRIVSARSAVNVASVIYFMGQDGFYVYTGSLSPLQSTVEKYVFDDINLTYNEKIFSGSNSSFNEVFWFYPSSGSIEPDRYVIYNYLDKAWSIGSFDMSSMPADESSTTSYGRTAWMDSSVFTNPRSTYVYSWDPTVTDGPMVEKTAVMVHETGSSANGSVMNCSIESGDMEISDGDRYSLLTRIFPDVKFFDTSEGIADPTLSIDVTAKDFPGSAESTVSSVTVNHSVSTGLNGVGSVPPQGNATAIRGRGRAMSVKMSSAATNYKWRLGDTRIDMQPDGRR